MTVKEEKLYMDLLPPDMPTPSFGLRIANHVIMAFPFAIVGLFLYDHAGFSATFSLAGINLVALTVSLACALIHVAVYYLLFKKNVSDVVVKNLEKNHQQLGILTRCLYGGIVEEVVFRFGMMSLFVWIGQFFISQTEVSVWAANVLASILFALAHLPGMYQQKIPVTKVMLFYSISMNIMVGLTCGWLFWQYGLAGAIMCHMLFHLVWHGFEVVGKRVRMEKV